MYSHWNERSSDTEGLAVVDLPDNIGLVVAVDGLKMVKPGGRDNVVKGTVVLLFMSALTCVKHFSLCQV